MIRLNLDDLLLCCGVVGGVFALLQLVIGAVMALLRPDSSLLVSGVVLPIVAGLMIFIVSVGHMGVSFLQAVQFGQTRRRALGLTLGLVGFETLCSMGLAAVLAGLERAVAPGVWKALSGAQYLGGARTAHPAPGAPADLVRQATLFVEDLSLAWWWFVVIALLGLASGLVVGALMQRFGGKGGWIVWGVWMVYLFGQQMVPRGALAGRYIWMLPLMGVLLAAALIWSVWSLLHAVVK